MSACTLMRFGDAIAVARLARLQNGVIAVLGVFVGAWWASGTLGTRQTWLTALASVGLATFANAFNDVCDEAIDRIAHPARPLPSGALSKRAAERVAWTGALIGVLLSAMVSPWMALASGLVIALMREYSLRIKRLGLPGNLVVAVLASLPFVYGAWSVGRPAAGLVLAAVAAPLHLARELAKDLDDAKGDAIARRTLARKALLGAMFAFLIALVAFAMPRPAAVIALLPATVIATVGAWRAVRGRPGSPRLFKFSMVLAMLSLFTLDPTRIK